MKNKEKIPAVPLHSPETGTIPSFRIKWIVFYSIAVLTGLLLAASYNYLLFHIVAEGFCVVVGIGIFIIAWNTRELLDNHYLLFLGTAFLFAEMLDLTHILAYKGMNIFPEYDGNLPTQLWIAARYTESLSLFFSPYFLFRKMKVNLIFGIYAGIFSLLLTVIFSGIFSDCFIEGTGLTPFKKFSEYLICMIFIAAAIRILKYRNMFDKKVFTLIFAAAAISVFSELLFTLYADPYSICNFSGHILKIVSFYLIYKALVETGLKRPYELIFRNLKQQEQELYNAHNELEQRVIERTAKLQKEIGERMQTEQLLAESERKFRTLVDAMDDVVFLLNQEQQHIGVFGKWLKRDNLSEEKFIGKTAREILGAEIAAIHEAANHKALAGENVAYEWSIETQMGMKFFHTALSPLCEENGNIVGIVGVGRDITELKQAEAALRESHKNYRNFFETIDDLIIIASPDGEILYTNQAVSQKLGYSCDELGKMQVLDLHPESYKKEAEEIFAAMFRGERDSCPLPLVRKNNTLIPVETRVWFGKWDGNNAVYGICKDLTKLRSALDMFQKMFDYNPSPMAVSNAATRKFLQVNEAFLKILGVTRNEVIGRTSSELNIFINSDTHAETLRNLMERGYFTDYEMIIKRVSDNQIIHGIFSGVLINYQGEQLILTVMMDITERKRLEQTLLEYKKAVESSKDLIAAVNHDYVYLFANKVFLRYKKMTEEQVVGHTVEEVLGKDIFEKYIKPKADESLKGNEIEYEMKMTYPELGLRCMSIFYSPLKDDKGNITGAVAVIRDITERNQQEQALRKKEEEFRQLFQHAPIGIVHSSADNFRILRSNPRFSEIIGYSEEEIKNMTFADYTHPDELQQDKIFLARLINREISCFEREKRYIHKNGSLIWGRVHVSSVQDTNGKPLYYIAAMEDITRHKQAEKELRLFKTLAESSREAIAISDASGQLIYINPAHEKLFGSSLEQAKKLNYRDYYPPESIEILNREVAPALARCESWQGIMDVFDASGRRFPLWEHAGAICDENGKMLYGFGFMHDDTKRIEAEKEIKNAKEIAEAANRAKSEFLANMSHEIRTPMNAVMGYAALLGKLIKDEKQKEYLNIIQVSAKNLLSLINDILDLSKIEAGKMEIVCKPVSPIVLLDEIKNIFRVKIAEKDIDLIIESDLNTSDVMLLDETRLRQILFNVVGNAVKFTETGYVKISVSMKKTSFLKKFDFSEPSELFNLIFKIEDTGIGISEDAIEKIFNPFEQQKREFNYYGGTGLGLAITRRLVEMMNGTISVVSQSSKGSCFTIEIRDIQPCSESIAEQPLPEIDINGKIDFKGASILLVEDNRYNIKLIKAILEPHNLHVPAVYNGQEAIEKLREFQPDLILMDMKMPVMDGYETTKRIKKDDMLKHIPVIALTASAMETDRERIKKIGINGYLSKPVDEAVLISELMKFLPYHQESSELSDSVEITDDYDLSPEIISEIISCLSGELMQEWKQIAGVMILGNWIKFGSKIKALGEKYNVIQIIRYGQEIINEADNFDIKKLKLSSEKYPEFIEIIKRLG